jgi:hypothetical protein
MRLGARGKAAADRNRAVKLEWHGDGDDSADFVFSKAIVEKSEFREYRRALTVADLLRDTRRKPSPLPLSQRSYGVHRSESFSLAHEERL